MFLMYKISQKIAEQITTTNKQNYRSSLGFECLSCRNLIQVNRWVEGTMFNGCKRGEL